MVVDVIVAVLGAAALLGRAGFCLYAAGLVRSKNSAGMVARLLCDLCLVTLVFWIVGAAILFQTTNAYFSLNPKFLAAKIVNGQGIESIVFFQLVMILMASGAVAGATAERIRFFPLCAASILLGGLLLPVTAHWAWYGWLADRGFIDVAGGAALQLAAGVCACVAAILVGARTGKFNRDGSSSMIPGHNLPLVGIGVMLMLVGWLPYVSGSAWVGSVVAGHANPFRHMSESASPAAMQTILAAAAAGFMSILVGQLRYGKPDIVLALIGFLGGCVAIAPGAGVVGAPAAALIGAVAGIFIPIIAVTIDLRMRIDDPTGIVAIQILGGTWGTLAVGFFCPLHEGASRGHQIGIQIVGIAAIVALSAVLSFILFALIKLLGSIRAKEADEFDGLDLAEHDIGAYPDFQQTTIKSYHLREM